MAEEEGAVDLRLIRKFRNHILPCDSNTQTFTTPMSSPVQAFYAHKAALWRSLIALLFPIAKARIHQVAVGFLPHPINPQTKYDIAAHTENRSVIAATVRIS
ncbi:MAG: hypothetical protein OEZ04_09500 [Nitrospinota bacterium]|nr:hypothetical protein [Nitrospinota bacterium]